MNSLWSLLTIIALLFFAFIASRVSDQRGRPLMIFNLIWVGALALIGMGAINFDDATATSWVSLLIGLAIFNIAGLAALTYKPTKPQLEIDDKKVALVSRIQLLILTGLYGVGVVVYLATIDTRFGIEMLFNDPEGIRSAQGESYLESVPVWARFLLYIGPVLIGLYGYRNSCTRPIPAIPRFAMLGLVGLSQLAMLQRTNLFMGVLFLVALLLAGRPASSQRSGPRRRVPVVVSLALLAVVLFASFQFLANSLGKTGTTHAQSLASDWVNETGLYAPIFYYTSGPMGFLNLMESENTTWPEETTAGYQNIGDYNPQTWGAATFRPLLQIFPFAPPFPSPSPFIQIGDGLYTNVYTWFEPAYRDFREIGMIVFSALMGWLLTRAYVTRFHSLPRFWIQSWLMSAMFISTFVSKLVTPLFLASLALLLALALWRSRGHSSRLTESSSAVGASNARPVTRSYRDKRSSGSGRFRG